MQATAEQTPKQKLQSLSIDLKLAQKMGQLPSQFDTCTTNDLLKVYYGIDKKEAKTFQQWKQEGKSVKKGEKGFCIWTAPIKREKTEAKPETEEYNFFSVCYLFTAEQVEVKEVVTA